MNYNCLKTLHIDRSTNPWAGMTGSWEEEEINKNIKALSLTDNNFSFFANLDKYKIKDKNLIGKHKDKKIMAVEKDFFSDLSKVDAAIRDKNKTEIIGIFNLDFLKIIDNQNLVCFLIEAQIINTYIHVESNLCLYNEENDDTYYKSYFKGEHIYFTNKKNIGYLDFSVYINKKTGEISII
jgi:hypothetical protein